MSDVDPFADVGFNSRLQKLISMLGSEQPGEAEAARRKLLEHLGHHRLSLTDVAMRLRPLADANRPSFTKGARELTLERQLMIARTARREAEAEARQADRRVAELQAGLQQAAFDVGRLLRGQIRMRFLAMGGWVVAAVAMLFVVRLHDQASVAPRALVTSNPVIMRNIDPDVNGVDMHAGPGELVGIVLIQDLAVRLTPSDDAAIRAFLNRGTHVVIERHQTIGAHIWLQIRSISGSGWVKGAAILR